MSGNYKKALVVLQKWTLLPPGREFMDFGLHLRERAQVSFPMKQLFPGSEADNSLKLNSLIRIADNKCGQEYKLLKVGSLGLEQDDFAKLFEKENFEKIIQIEKSTSD